MINDAHKTKAQLIEEPAELRNKLDTLASGSPTKADGDFRTGVARLSTTLRMARAGHWEYDVDRDVLTSNDDFYRLCRITTAEVGGCEMSSTRDSWRFCHPDDAAGFQRIVSELIPAY